MKLLSNFKLILKRGSPRNSDKQVEGVEVKKHLTSKFYMMVTSGAVLVVGIAVFAIYLFAVMIDMLGLLGIALILTGGFFLRYYWKKAEGISSESIGEEAENAANCLNIYPDKVVFELMPKPEGFPMDCTNLKKKYYVNIWDEKAKRLIPFVLPDQQFYDPLLFSQRVLALPAHRKIFERKPKLLQKLKTAFLVAGIGIVWLLIITTTGG